MIADAVILRALDRAIVEAAAPDHRATPRQVFNQLRSFCGITVVEARLARLCAEKALDVVRGDGVAPADYNRYRRRGGVVVGGGGQSQLTRATITSGG